MCMCASVLCLYNLLLCCCSYSLLIGIKKSKFVINGDNTVTDPSDGMSSTENSPMYRAAHTEVLSTVTNEHGADIESQNRCTSAHATYKANAVAGPSIYYFGVVDFLQDWSTIKKAERAFKIFIKRQDSEGKSI